MSVFFFYVFNQNDNLEGNPRKYETYALMLKTSVQRQLIIHNKSD